MPDYHHVDHQQLPTGHQQQGRKGWEGGGQYEATIFITDGRWKMTTAVTGSTEGMVTRMKSG